MRVVNLCCALTILVGLSASMLAQEDAPREQLTQRDAPAKKAKRAKKRPAKHGAPPAQVLEDRFDREAPQIGDPLPDVVGLDAEGNQFPLRKLKGHYTVLTFGCLT
jgi:hypothetical protein